jgi:hypothetical protein
MPAAGAAVTADRDHQDRRSPPERFVRQPPDDGVSRCPLAAATPTPARQHVGLDDPTGQHRPIRLEALTHHLQTEFVQTAERSQIRAHIGSVNHVEVFQMDGVGTSIIGRPRPSPRHRHAHSYTLECEDPAKLGVRLRRAFANLSDRAIQ